MRIFTLLLLVAACTPPANFDDEKNDEVVTPPTVIAGGDARILIPADGFVTNAESVVVSGTSTETSVTVNGVGAANNSGWQTTVPLALGDNTIIVAVANNAAADAIVVTRVDDSAAPDIAVTFPPVASLADGDVITVRATISDGTPRVTVNGADVDVTMVGNELRANVAVAAGENEIIITATDTFGNVGTATRLVTRPGPLLSRSAYMAYDGTHLFVYDEFHRAILRVAADGSTSRLASTERLTDLTLSNDGTELYGVDERNVWRVDKTTGERTRISGEGRGDDSEDLYELTHVLPHPTLPGTLLVSSQGSIYAVDTTTGDVTIYANVSAATTYVRSLVTDGTRILFADDNAVHALPLTAGGAPTLVSQNGVQGTGDTLSTITNIVMLGAEMFVSTSDGRIFLVDGDDGDRHLAGTVTLYPSDLVADVMNDRLLLASGGQGLFSVNKVTAARAPLPRVSFGLPRPLRANRLTFVDDTLFFVDYELDMLLRTDLATGATEELSSGPPAIRSDLAVLGDELVGLDGNGDVLRIDRATGARQSIVCASSCGPTFATNDAPTVLLRDPDRLLYIDTDNSEVRGLAISLTTGVRSVLFDFAEGEGPLTPQNASDAALGGDLLFVLGLTENDEILRITLEGDRVRLVAPTVGQGPVLESPSLTVWNETAQRLFVLDNGPYGSYLNGPAALFSIDPINGDRIELDQLPTTTRFGSVSAFAVDEAREIAYLLSDENQSIVAFDLVTKSAVIIAR